jgi:hypothetical protein
MKHRRKGGRGGQDNEDTNRDDDGLAFHGLLLMDSGSLWYPKRGQMCKTGIEKNKKDPRRLY